MSQCGKQSGAATMYICRILQLVELGLTRLALTTTFPLPSSTTHQTAHDNALSIPASRLRVAPADYTFSPDELGEQSKLALRRLV